VNVYHYLIIVHYRHLIPGNFANFAKSFSVCFFSSADVGHFIKRLLSRAMIEHMAFRQLNTVDFATLNLSETSLILSCTEQHSYQMSLYYYLQSQPVLFRSQKLWYGNMHYCCVDQIRPICYINLRINIYFSTLTNIVSIILSDTTILCI